MKLPPTSGSKADLVRALTDLARRFTGGMHPEDADEVNDWIDRAEAALTGQSLEATRTRETDGIQRCSVCKRLGHKRTTCPEGVMVIDVVKDSAITNDER